MITSLSEFRGHSRSSMWSRIRSTIAMTLLLIVTSASAQEHFKSPDDAVAALVNAAKATDRAAVMRLLGPGSGEIVSSGDAVADATARKRVLEAYDSKHQVVTEGEDKAVLVIGNEEWPFPIPLVRKDGSWQFDTAAGREEILARRIGRNELNAIEASLAFVDAQQEYAEKGVAGNGVYAQRIVSHPGTKDGLYWPAASEEDESPLGGPRRQRSGRRLPCRAAAHALPRVLLPGAHTPGAERTRRCNRLRGTWQDDRRVRAGGLSGGIRQFRRDDFCGQSPGRHVPEGSGAEHRAHRRRDDDLQS